MSLRDSADRRRTVVDMMVSDAFAEMEPVNRVPLERPSANGVYRGRCKVRVLPPGVCLAKENQFLFGAKDIKHALIGGSRRYKK